MKCPKCKDGVLTIDKDGGIEEPYIPGYYVRGRHAEGLPRRYRKATVAGCNCCEYIREIK